MRAPRAGRSGALGCATAERHLQIGRAEQRTCARGRSPPRRAARLLVRAHTRSPRSATTSIPETGNGGYTSVHTDVTCLRRASNRFLPGTHVVLTDLATQCLTDFSLDFERKSPNSGRPGLTVGSVHVNGLAAAFRFVQPTYPGRPERTGRSRSARPRGRAGNPVGGPENNPLPPACSPELPPTNPNSSPERRRSARRTSRDHARRRSRTGDVHRQGHLFRPARRPQRRRRHDRGLVPLDQPAGDGSFVTTEPVGTEDWMPLNDHPSREADLRLLRHRRRSADGDRQRRTRSSQRQPARRELPGRLDHLALALAGADRQLPGREQRRPLRPERARRAATASTTTRRRQRPRSRRTEDDATKAIMDHAGDIVDSRRFNGPFPFTTDGVIDRRHQRQLRGGDGDEDHLRRRPHRPRHVQPREHAPVVGRQRLGGELQHDLLQGGSRDARRVPLRAPRNAHYGGPGTPAGARRSRSSLVGGFQHSTTRTPASLWTAAPSDPTARATLFSGATTYLRPGIAYIALRQILGPASFAAALQQMQSHLPAGGDHRAAARGRPSPTFLPNPSAACPVPAGPGSSLSGSTRSIRPAAVPTGRRSPGPASTAAAFTADRSTVEFILDTARRTHFHRRSAARGRGCTHRPERVLRVTPSGRSFAELLADPAWLPGDYQAPAHRERNGRRYRPVAALPGRATGSLSLFSASSCRPASMTPVHDHLAWGLVGLYRGTQDEEIYAPTGRPARAASSRRPLAAGRLLRAPSAARRHPPRPHRRPPTLPSRSTCSRTTRAAFGDTRTTPKRAKPACSARVTSTSSVLTTH